MADEGEDLPPKVVPQRNTVNVINDFVVKTCAFLNRFSDLCEDKLSLIESQMERLEVSICLLEAKLGSIPGFEASAQPGTPAAPPAAQQNVQAAPGESAVAGGAPPPPPPPPPSSSDGTSVPETQLPPRMFQHLDPSFHAV
jgi:WASH complex subunit CCDC53